MLKPFNPLSRKKSIKNLAISEPMCIASTTSPSSPVDYSVSKSIHSSTHDSIELPPLPSLNLQMAIPRSTPENTVILITKFDFKSENQHELTVGVGEALKLIERKGNGWILVKPIGRLSEPGLIPASYVRIVKLANKGEKNPYSEAKIDDKWLSSREESYLPTPRSTKKDSVSSTNSTSSSNQRHNSDTGSNKYSSVQSSIMSDNEQQHFSFQSNTTTSTSSASSPTGEFYASSGLVRNASCHNGRYWYRVDITMNDGKKRYLCRYYQDFYKLHCAIIESLRSLPDFEEQEESYISKLPPLPDPIPRPDLQTLSSILLQRVQSLNVYIFKIVQNKNKLDYTKILKEWTSPRLGDLEVAPYENITNEEIEKTLEPLPTRLNKPTSTTGSSPTSTRSSSTQEEISQTLHRKRPSLNISTSMTPPLPAPKLPSVFNGSPSFTRTTSDSTLSLTSADTSSPMSFNTSPMIWQSPTMSSGPSWGKSISTSTIHEGQEKNYDAWLQEPTQPLNSAHSPKLRTSSSTLQAKKQSGEYLKVKVFANDDIFALRVKNDASLVDLKQSIFTRLELDVEKAILKLYYKNHSRNYFSPLNDELDLSSAFDQPKVAIKVHVWANEEVGVTV